MQCVVQQRPLVLMYVNALMKQSSDDGSFTTRGALPMSAGRYMVAAL